MSGMLGRVHEAPRHTREDLRSPVRGGRFGTFGYVFGVLCAMFLFAGSLGDCARASAQQLTVVSSGSTHAVIVPGRDHPDASMRAARELQKHLFLSTSVKVPITSDGVDSLSSGEIPIIVGAGDAARARGVNEAKLAPEAYRIKITPDYMVLVGHDITSPGRHRRTIATSRATQWAVDYLLGKYAGVRWLWPGRLGTYVPKHESIAFPVMDTTRRPAMDMRQLLSRVGGLGRFTSGLASGAERRAEVRTELDNWKSRHEMGARVPLHFDAAFRHWWVRYHAEHPDYFAVPPAGYSQPWPRPVRVKLRIGNPAVADQIIANWRAAGRPDFWDVSPNDGAGFDTSAASRAMDYPPDQSIRGIWRGRASLTIRYVTFWNDLLKRMRKEKPDAQIGAYAYGPYRDLPKPVTLEPGMNIALVGGYNQKAREEWSKWSKAGARLYLRPNWWWLAGPAPFLPLDKTGDYFKFTMAHGLQGFRFSRLNGYWGSQGPYYYLIARLSERPDLSVDDVIDEYASAFGDAAGAIKDYLHYWETLSDKVGFAVPAGGSLEQDAHGQYAQLVKHHHIPRNPLKGSWRAIPYLYTDGVLQKANKILDRAMKLAQNDPETVRQRIAFLRSGLRYLHVVRNLVAGKPFNEGVGGEAAKAESFEDYLHYLSKEGVVWSAVASKQIKRFVHSR